MPREAIADLKTILIREIDEESSAKIKDRLLAIHLCLGTEFRKDKRIEEALQEFNACLDYMPRDGVGNKAFQEVLRLLSSVKAENLRCGNEEGLATLLEETASNPDVPLAAFDKDDIMSIVRSLPLAVVTPTRMNHGSAPKRPSDEPAPAIFESKTGRQEEKTKTSDETKMGEAAESNNAKCDRKDDQRLKETEEVAILDVRTPSGLETMTHVAPGTSLLGPVPVAPPPDKKIKIRQLGQHRVDIFAWLMPFSKGQMDNICEK